MSNQNLVTQLGESIANGDWLFPVLVIFSFFALKTSGFLKFFMSIKKERIKSLQDAMKVAAISPSTRAYEPRAPDRAGEIVNFISKRAVVAWATVAILTSTSSASVVGAGFSSEELKSALDETKELDCAHLVIPQDHKIKPALYARILGCHQIWMNARDHSEATQLGARADLRHSVFVMGSEESEFDKVERTIADMTPKDSPLHDGNVPLSGALLGNATFYARTSPPHLNFGGADLQGAQFFGTNLSHRNFAGADCSGCIFYEADLTGAAFYSTNLIGAHFSDAKLAEATFDGSQINEVEFNPLPNSMPTASSFTSAHGLKNLTYAPTAYGQNSAILRLREEMRKTGNKDLLREVNFAIRNNPNYYSTRPGYWFNDVMFGGTIGYGLYLMRPIGGLILLILVSSVIYLLSMTRRSHSGIFVVWSPDSLASNEDDRPKQLTIDNPFPEKFIQAEVGAPDVFVSDSSESRWRRLWNAVKHTYAWGNWIPPHEKEKTVRPNTFVAAFILTLIAVITLIFLGQAAYLDYTPKGPDSEHTNSYAMILVLIAFLLILSLWFFPNRQMRKAWQMALWFSLLSTFRFGWRDLSVGTWLSIVQTKEYTLRPTGWVKTVAGFQSIFGLFLVGLWAVCYFTGPLE